MWVRGLKLVKLHALNLISLVAPRVGAWIEIVSADSISLVVVVAPRVGAWIEIVKFACGSLSITSHPVWVRGLKFPQQS